jgi:hypothetical protein
LIAAMKGTPQPFYCAASADGRIVVLAPAPDVEPRQLEVPAAGARERRRWVNFSRRLPRPPIEPALSMAWSPHCGRPLRPMNQGCRFHLL